MPRRKNSGSFKPGKAPFNDPEIRARAIATRLANPHGKRGAHRYEDIPGVWTDHDRTTLGEKIGSKEKAALAQLSFDRLAGLHAKFFDTLHLILDGIQQDQLAGKPLTPPQAQVISKIADKVAPDLRADVSSQGGKVTRFVIGAPLRRLVENGATIAGEITETEEPSDE